MGIQLRTHFGKDGNHRLPFSSPLNERFRSLKNTVHLGAGPLARGHVEGLEPLPSSLGGISSQGASGQTNQDLVIRKI